VTATEERLAGDADNLPPRAGEMDSPGARLRAAREAAGLSLDQVAQQLKLAPRQVKALEDEDFGKLPGRTFARGFVRNYARLLNLDGDDLLALMPDAAHAPALGSPALQSTGTTIAELPTAAVTRSNFMRWVIPLVLVACIVGAAAYEWYRGGLVAAVPNATPEAATTPAPLVLSYRGPSWTEVRDRDGQLLIARLVAAGSEQSIRGTPPFEVVIGNAHVVALTYHGKPIDLSRYTRQNVARLRLS
jgi:cytoskeleton protein RodZ